MVTLNEINLRYIFLTKNGYVSYLSMVNLLKPYNDKETVNACIIKYDERDKDNPLVKQFNSVKECQSEFENAVKISIQRGWEISWQGKPCFG